MDTWEMTLASTPKGEPLNMTHNHDLTLLDILYVCPICIGNTLCQASLDAFQPLIHDNKGKSGRRLRKLFSTFQIRPLAVLFTPRSLTNRTELRGLSPFYNLGRSWKTPYIMSAHFSKMFLKLHWSIYTWTRWTGPRWNWKWADYHCSTKHKAVKFATTLIGKVSTLTSKELVIWPL